MPNMILGIGDLGVSNELETNIKTFALGSCIAVVIYDRVMHTGGMVHIALPDSKTDKKKSLEKPGYFADSAIPELMHQMKKKNPNMVKHHLITKIAGGASVMDENSFFNIGGKNIEAVKRLLRDQGLAIFKEDIGGSISRTVTLDITSGLCLLFNPAKGVWEL